MGDVVLSTKYYTGKEYRDKVLNSGTLNYWREKEKAQNAGSDKNSLIPNIKIAGDTWKNLFGSNKVEIRPQDSAEAYPGCACEPNG